MSVFTLSSIPEYVERELRRRALQERKDIHAVILELLERGLGLRSDCHTDLDFLIGSWECDPGFDDAVAMFEEVNDGCARRSADVADSPFDPPGS